jgi:hypothetical protein
MKTSSVVLLAVVIVIYSGCSRNKGLQMKLDDAVQRRASIDERIVDWGAPAGKTTLSDGRIVYTWTHPWTDHSVNYNTKGNQAYAVQHMCTIVITTSADNTIQGYNYRDC